MPCSWRTFRPFQRKVAWHGILNSLSQALVKLAAPGVPDFYQGTELWDLCLVDPDNRRPVDYEHRAALLAALRRGWAEDPPGLLRELAATMTDGRSKLFLIQAGLGARRERPALFLAGEYLPLAVTGGKREHLIAFARRLEGNWALVLAPRFTVGLVGEGQLPLGRELWEDTAVVLPPGAPGRWRDRVTGRELQAEELHLPVGEALSAFPAALLLNPEEV